MSDIKRPAIWKDILGQEAAVERLRRMLEQDRLPHALLFAGPSGIALATAAGSGRLVRLIRATLAIRLVVRTILGLRSRALALQSAPHPAP